MDWTETAEGNNFWYEILYAVNVFRIDFESGIPESDITTIQKEYPELFI